MANEPEKQSTPEAPQESGQNVERKERTGSSDTLQKVASVVGEAGEAAEGVSVMAEKVSETASESAGEQGGSGATTGQQGDDDDAAQGEDTTFVFDDAAFPSQDEMILLIEKQIRKDIKKLEKEVNRYRGNIFRSPDFQKLNEAVSEIRRKRRLLSELVHLAYDALKNLYQSFFNPKTIK